MTPTDNNNFLLLSRHEHVQRSKIQAKQEQGEARQLGRAQKQREDSLGGCTHQLYYGTQQSASNHSCI